MKKFEEIAQLNRELLKMVDFTHPLWNGGARYWLEHRGPKLARIIADAPGLKLWLQAPPVGSLDYPLKVCSLFADHVVVGHFGPLPPYHLGLAFPWRMDESTEIPPPPGSQEKPVAYPLRVDAVRRPLPPVASQCLLGSIRTAVELGIVSYFPASIIYAPLPGTPWPSPAEILSRDGSLPKGHRILGVKKETSEQQRESKKTDQGTRTQSGSSERLGWTIGEQGFPEFDDPRIPKMWEWSDNAIKWESIFSALIASGGIEVPAGESVRLSRLPDATLKLRLPYLEDADWEMIHKIRAKESDALQSLRESLLKACSRVSAEYGSKRFSNAVAEIQERIVDKGVEDVRKSFRNKTFRKWMKVAGMGVATVTLEIACFLGLPPLTALVAGGAALKGALDVALDIRKEEQEWKNRAKTEMPMYFLWRLKSRR